jgi:hypothetical protein
MWRSSLPLAVLLAVSAGCSDGPTLPRYEPDVQLDVVAGLPGGLIHLWSGEGNANDGVGDAHGKLGSTQFGAGLNGRAFSFSGIQSAIVDLPMDISPGPLPRLTMGMLVNLRGLENARGWVLGHDDGGYDRSLALTDVRYGSGVAGGTGIDPHASSLITLKDHLNTWHCVAAAYDGVAGTATFYADGASQTVPATPGGGLSFATLGGLRNHPGHTVNGLVDEVFMFDRALTVAELDRVCDSFSDPPPVVSITVERAMLWPVSHKMVTVARVSASDFSDPAPSLAVTVSSNEAITDADWAVIENADGTVDVQVRAEREGTGTGRVYTITATATDSAGGGASATGTVTVPHDQGRAGK